MREGITAVIDVQCPSPKCLAAPGTRCRGGFFCKDRRVLAWRKTKTANEAKRAKAGR